MHEFSICERIVDTVLAELECAASSPTRLLRTRVVVGRLDQIVPDYLCLAYTTLTRDTPATLNEIARQSNTGIVIVEENIPVRLQVRTVCDLLGLDLLYVACEGRLAAICRARDASRLLATMRTHALGKDAAEIGEVRTQAPRLLEMETSVGGRHMVDWLAGEQLP